MKTIIIVNLNNLLAGITALIKVSILTVLFSFFVIYFVSVQVSIKKNPSVTQLSFCQQTYNLDAQIGESSACATALLCGVKANFETLGLDAGGLFEDCFSVFNSRVDCLLSWAQKEGEML